MKRIISLLMAGLILVSSFAVFAEDVEAVPMLISVQEEVLKEGFELIRGFVVSYENQTLTIKVEGQEYPVTVYDRNNAFYEDLKDVKEDDIIEVVAEYGEATFYLSEIKTISSIIICEAPVPTLYNNLDTVSFDLVQDGDIFTILLDENPSTGYVWSFKVKDENKVEFIEDIYTTSDEVVIGARGIRSFTFEIKEDGITTILFENSRPWDETSTMATLEILAYKNNDKVFIEENEMVYALDEQPELYKNKIIELSYKGEVIESEVKAQKVDGIMMIPLSSTLEKMGYSIKWIAETSSVEINKGAQWTSITIGKNAYFKNRMAARPLSAAPVIVNQRTLVPAEFFTVILDRAFQIENGNMKFSSDEMAIHSGYVKDITYDETGTMSITLVNNLESTEIFDQTIIHTSNAYTYLNKEVIVSEYINVICPPIMTMSIPAQTTGYIVY